MIWVCQITDVRFRGISYSKVVSTSQRTISVSMPISLAGSPT